MQKNRPAPLTFKPEPEPSPLLHATFGSPQASPTASAMSTAFASPTLVSPVYPTKAEPTSNAKSKQRADPEDMSDADSRSSNREFGQEVIVKVRNDAIPTTAASQAAEIVDALATHRSPPSTPRSPRASQTSNPRSPKSEKRFVSNPDPEPIPPPPYSPRETPAQVASSSQVPVLANSPPRPVVVPPPGHPQARPIDPNRAALGPETRQSLFMPHPGAPKPAAAPAGPMYNRQPMPAPQRPQHVGPPLGSSLHILNAAFAARREGRQVPPTIYGRFEYELTLSMGPVPVTFTHEPQNNVPANRARPPMPWVPPSRTGTPASRAASPAIHQAGLGMGSGLGMGVPQRSATSPPIPSGGLVPPIQRANTISPTMGGADPVAQRMMSPPATGGQGPMQMARSPPTGGPVRMMSPPAAIGMAGAVDPAGRRMMSPPAMGAPQVPASLHAMAEPIGRANTTSPAGRRNAGSPGVTAQIDQVLAGVAAQNQPIPRANFVPAAGTVRPRSRSFSGMTSGSGLSIRTEALSDKRCARNMF